jgi:D-alanine-D-alanine ligase
MFNKHIEIVSSTVAGLSSMSRSSREGVFDVLSAHYSDVRITLVNNISDLRALVERCPDLVFLGMGFIPSNPDLGQNDPVKIWLSEYLDKNGVAYTGSPKSARLLENNKPLAKQCVIDAGLSSSRFFVTKRDQPLAREDISLNYPLFIKPANQGGGKGIDTLSVAHNFLEAERKVSLINDQLKTNSLIEEYLPGREFSVAILKNDSSNAFSVMPIELVAELDKNGDRMLSKAVKSSNNEVVSEVVDPLMKAKVCRLALGAFKALGARDYGRIDIRLDLDSKAFFLEANLIPSLIDGYGSFPKACLINSGLSFSDMILTITRLGLIRNTNYLSQPKFIETLGNIKPASDLVQV